MTKRKTRKRPPSPPVIPEVSTLVRELVVLRKQAHDRLQTAEYEFWKIDRALGAAQRSDRERLANKS